MLGTANPPLTLDDWAARNLPEQNYLLGNLFSTTTRVLLFAPTGIGKTLLCTALGLAIADGKSFLHWREGHPCRVLYVDGEMSNREDKRRLSEATKRHGGSPAGFHFLCIADLAHPAPLNTEAGRIIIEEAIKYYDVNFIIFDNVMSLIEGSMKEEDSWTGILPWVRSLTTRDIGQLWVHHTGHDESRSYGTKTLEWQMDIVMGLKRVARSDTNVSFKLTFSKARPRNPVNQSDFREVEIALINNKWTLAAGVTKLNGTTAKFFEALKTVNSEKGISLNGNLVATIEAWRSECITRGLINPQANAASARALFSKHRKKLIEARLIECNGEYAWPCA